MSLPQDPENWTVWHAERRLANAWKRFDEYEAKIDFEWPQEKQDDCYRPYRFAREEAVMVCGQVASYLKAQADVLP